MAKGMHLGSVKRAEPPFSGRRQEAWVADETRVAICAGREVVHCEEGQLGMKQVSLACGRREQTLVTV